MQDDTNQSFHNESQFTTGLHNTNELWSGHATFGVVLALGSGLAQAGFIIAEKKVLLCDICNKKTDLKIFVVIIPKEGLAGAPPILLWL